MGSTTIAWTNSTWTVTTGCRTYGKDCANCYAEVMSKRLGAMARADEKAGKEPGRKSNYLNVIGDNGRWNNVVQPAPDNLRDPMGWKKSRMIFVNSMSDLFYGNDADRQACENQKRQFTPVPFEYIDKVFAVMAMCPQHTFQVLTKRSDRMEKYFTLAGGSGRVAYEIHRSNGAIIPSSGPMRASGYPWPLPNVWLGASAGYQQAADERLPHLKSLSMAGWTTWSSFEPLLELTMIPSACYHDDESPASCWLDWAVIGAESGPRRRPMELQWARSLLRQCLASGVKCFVKQAEIDGAVTEDVTQFPKELQVREFPKVAQYA